LFFFVTVSQSLHGDWWADAIMNIAAGWIVCRFAHFHSVARQ